MQSQLNKALSLAKKTGDRLIVFESPESETAYVVMNLDQYEDILDCGCGEDCSDEDYECDCGHEHDLEESEPNIDIDVEDDFVPEHFDYASEVRNLTEEELLDKINRDIALWKESQKEILDEESASEEDKNSQQDGGESEIRNKTKWAIRNEVKESADEIIEEDRHYLEEVKY